MGTGRDGKEGKEEVLPKYDDEGREQGEGKRKKEGEEGRKAVFENTPIKNPGYRPVHAGGSELTDCSTCDLSVLSTIPIASTSLQRALPLSSCYIFGIETLETGKPNTRRRSGQRSIRDN